MMIVNIKDIDVNYIQYGKGDKNIVLLHGWGQNIQMISDFYCTQCGSQGLPVVRTAKHAREPGHLKKLYCVYCKTEKNHAEVRPIYGGYNYEDFQLEMKYHNFDLNGNRKKPYKTFKADLKKEDVI